MLGRTLGHYRITERIGAGGMAAVFRARDERLDRDVAIKVLRDGTLDEPSRRHFRNEARALSRSVHPAIATIHDFDTEDQTDYLVMEYIPGQTLDERLARGALPEKEVLRLGVQLAEGLDAAHAQGVVHRDLKPSNLRITPEGRLKILDFGLARFKRSDADTTHSATGGPRFAGTLPYMAPELLEGAEPDERADIYAAGAVLYEMACGRRPHPEQQDVRLLRAILDDAPPAPSLLCPGLSPQLETCIVKALDKDPDRRYQSARELLVDLQRAAAAPGGRAAPARPTRRLRRVSTGGATAAILSVAVLVAAWSAWRATAPTTVEPRSERARLAILRPPAPTLAGDTNDWPRLVQALLAGALTGTDNLGVIDPLSLNEMVSHQAGRGGPTAGEPLYALPGDLGATHVLVCQFVGAGPALQLQANLVDPATGEITYSSLHPIDSAPALATAANAIADDVVVFLQLARGDLASTADIRPWVSYAKHDLQAVRAFVQATEHLYAFEPDDAERDLRRALEADPSFVPPRLFLISALKSHGRVEEAEEHYARLLDEEGHASPFEQELIAYARARLDDNLDGQARHLEAALAYSPANYILLANLADVRASQGDCASAVATLEPAVNARWRYPPVYELWGWCAVVVGKFDEARRVLEDAVSIPPVAPHVYALLEALAIADGDPVTAARYAALFADRPRDGEPLDPAMAIAYEALADRCLRAGALETAETLCRRAVAIDPSLAAPYRALGEIAERRGDTAGAIAGFTEYLRRAPDSADAAAIRARLQRLQAAPTGDDLERRRS